MERNQIIGIAVIILSILLLLGSVSVCTYEPFREKMTVVSKSSNPLLTLTNTILKKSDENKVLNQNKDTFKARNIRERMTVAEKKAYKESLRPGQKLGKEFTQRKEPFISSGTSGAWYDERNNAVRGPHVYSNQMIQNRKNWADVVGTAKAQNIASDGRGTLGASAGDGFEKAWDAQQKIVDAWNNVPNNYMTNEEFNALSKEIAVSVAPKPDHSLLNRGNQNRGKLSILPDKLVCVIEEKYMPDRDKNYTVYKTNSVVHCQGYDIDTNRIGSEFLDTSLPKYVKNNNKRQVTSAGVTLGLNVKEPDEKDKNIEQFKAKYIQGAGNNVEKFQGNKEMRVVDSSDGSTWFTRNAGQVKVF